ncbi:MAG: GNAT family N-acetyltransferase [Phenylobacterium zucineum]|nr:MAG: GNAT family N-acetyltransferase [Phenylobacterium zucineum]
MIRYANPSDHPAIHALVTAAFTRPDEAALVERLRADGDSMFELVEIIEDALVGHILFSRMWADSLNLYAALAPVSVHPDLQRRGTGGRLVRAGLEAAKEFGAAAVIVLGHPGYYPRFGFTTAAAQNLKCAYSGLPAFMAITLEPGGLDQPLTVVYPDAFGI